MQLIVDSGGTKSVWVALKKDDGSRQTFEAPGLQPAVQSEEDISRILDNEFPSSLKALQPEVIHFYGAGCKGKENIRLIREQLKSLWPKAELHINHDLLAAAKSTLGDKEGVAAIIGTGSSAGYFDGEKICQQKPALGYILGDEGSGAWIGKKLLKDYCYGHLPEEVKNTITPLLPERAVEPLINKVYKEAYPNRFLASLASGLGSIQDHPYAKGLIRKGFNSFMEIHIAGQEESKTAPLAFTGSVAYHFAKHLKAVAHDLGFTHITIQKAPLEGLIQYHLNRKNP